MTADKPFAENLILNNGYYNGEDDNTMGDNPRALRIVEYTNRWGGLAYGITLEGEDQNRYLEETEFVNDPKIIWEYKK